MTDYGWATRRLAVGGSLSSRTDVARLLADGVTHIVNCQAEKDDSPLLSGFPVAYLWNGACGEEWGKSIDWFARTIQFAVSCLSVPGKKLFVHCSSGIKRGPSAGYAILRALGLDSVTAEALIKSARPISVLAYKADVELAVAALGW